MADTTAHRTESAVPATVTRAANRRPTARQPNVSIKLTASYAALDGSQQLYEGGQEALTDSYAALGGSQQVYAGQNTSTDSYAALDGSQQLYARGHDAGKHGADDAVFGFGFGKTMSGLGDDVASLPAEYTTLAIGDSTTYTEPQKLQQTQSRRVSQVVNKIEMLNLAQASGADGAPPLSHKLSQSVPNTSKRNARSSHNVAAAVRAMEHEAARNESHRASGAVSMRQQLWQQGQPADSSAA